MPTTNAIHYNTPENNGITRCGRRLGKVTWREDITDVTCNMCKRLVTKDMANVPHVIRGMGY